MNGKAPSGWDAAVVGKRAYTDNSGPKYQPPLYETFIAIISLGVYTAWPYVMFLLLLFAWYPPIFFVNLVLYSTLLMPAQLYWPNFLNWDLFRTWREYFSFSYKMTEQLDFNRKVIFAEFPHGTYPMGPLLAGTLIPKMFPGRKIYSVAASVLFRIPGLKHAMTWMGSQPADRQTFQSLVNKGDVAVVVGGIAEMFMQYKDKEQVLLASRKGFIKMALQNGVDIVPVYHFGNSRVLSIGPQSFMELCRKMRMSFGMLIGRWGLPIPKRHPIYMVAGRAVKVKTAVKPDDPSFPKAVDELHLRVQEELRRLYDENKAEFGWENRPLFIV
ncbi:hypothetical protein BSKO_07580 [Bryopsis sp. KO-2023]|nr:hypothetical protein BSKO_07580 [Bryopsis sp. KO-2023]